MMVVGLLFLIGGVGVLLTMNRLLWPLDESAPAGSPGQPGRTPVAGGRPGPARHPRERTPARASANRTQRQARAAQVQPPARTRAVPATPPPARQQPAAPAEQPVSRARVRVVTVPDRKPAHSAAGGRVYGGARRA